MNGVSSGTCESRRCSRPASFRIGICSRAAGPGGGTDNGAEGCARDGEASDATNTAPARPFHARDRPRSINVSLVSAAPRAGAGAGAAGVAGGGAAGTAAAAAPGRVGSPRSRSRVFARSIGIRTVPAPRSTHPYADRLDASFARCSRSAIGSVTSSAGCGDSGVLVTTRPRSIAGLARSAASGARAASALATRHSISSNAPQTMS